MANSKLKFTYFDLRGIGEVMRLILAYGGKEYEDIRIKHADWDELKPKMKPLNQMPVLEIDGQLICQSLAIRAFLAREFGLYGKNNWEDLTIETVIGTMTDVLKEQSKWYYLPEGPEKEKIRANSPYETIKHLAYLESLLATNGTGYFVGNALTVADLVMFDMVTGYLRLSLNYSDEEYPWIAKNKAKVLENANIAAYVASRPDSDV